MEKNIVNFSYFACFIALVLGFISIGWMIISFSFIPLKILGICFLSFVFFSIFILALDKKK